ncbi:hypothetical protein ACFLRM_01250 [Acidobacteriota bacterium]
MKKAKETLRILALILIISFLFSCNPIENETDSNSLLVLLSLRGSDVDNNVVDFLQSDVVFFDSVSGANTVASDAAKVTFTTNSLDPNPVAVSSIYNTITVTRYIVSYLRSDGKSIEGVDVPYSFEGYMSSLIQPGMNTEIAFVIVRDVAKVEPPLINLAEGRGEGVLEVKAKVDFYGHDMTNHQVKATGYLSIFFANFADKEAPTDEEEQ